MKRYLYIQTYRTASNSIFANQELADELLQKSAGKFTDLFVSIRSDSDGRSYFDSNLYNLRPERLDGLLPGVYFIKRAAELGMRVHAWLYTAYMSSYQEMIFPPSSSYSSLAIGDPDCSTVNWINWSMPDVREMVAQVSADFCQANPGLAGIHLDYIRTDASQRNCEVITPDHITKTIEQVRDTIAPLAVTVAVSGAPERNARTNRDVATWLDGLVDGVVMMSYTSLPLAGRIEYAQSLPNNQLLLPGVPVYVPDSDAQEQALLSEHLAAWNSAGWTDLAFFDSRALTDEVLDMLPDLPRLDDTMRAGVPYSVRLIDGGVVFTEMK